jgi:hypothetical protein
MLVTGEQVDASTVLGQRPVEDAERHRVDAGGVEEFVVNSAGSVAVNWSPKEFARLS